VTEQGTKGESVMNVLVNLSQQLSARLVRTSLAVVLIWIGALKFADPSPVVGLLQASLPVFAFNGFVYLLGLLEVAGGVCLLAGIGLRWVGLLAMGLFAGTLTIFVVAPGVTYGEAGFPYLSLPGEFLLKDLVLFAVSFALVGAEAPADARVHARRPAEARA
jgi:uncharacterized membrane protein YkgB